jgi:hypothetical protein
MQVRTGRFRWGLSLVVDLQFWCLDAAVSI